MTNGKENLFSLQLPPEKLPKKLLFAKEDKNS
jgi:hypothetical protein